MTVTPPLGPLLAWARVSFHERLDGLPLDWYDGHRGHSIGPHHDSREDMVEGALIVTISLGEGRVFRFTLPVTKSRRDFPSSDGNVCVMPCDTNLAWKHEVPRSAKSKGRRISVTLRAFED